MREAVWSKRVMTIRHAIREVMIAVIPSMPMMMVITVWRIAVAANVRRIKAAHIQTERSNHGMRLLFMS
ncbi:hypothetical protein GLN3_04635 [Geobacillus lituanicus]|nr:hypothetical protein IB49_03510 [Geobacillus sp. LC300]ASS86466.1 hypothetical protein GLN3_04635 [Geobacillus lituanicus]